MSNSREVRVFMHSQHVRLGAMDEFVEHWKEYNSPSAAAAAIAKSWGVGRTTLSEWLRAEGKWPHTRVSANLALAAENERLRNQVKALKSRRTT